MGEHALSHDSTQERLTVGIRASVADRLEFHASFRQVSRTELANQALALYDIVAQLAHAGTDVGENYGAAKEYLCTLYGTDIFTEQEPDEPTIPFTYHVNPEYKAALARCALAEGESESTIVEHSILAFSHLQNAK